MQSVRVGERRPTMSVRAFLLDTLARIGSSIFAGTLVSCLIVERLEPVHLILMGEGLIFMLSSWPRQGESP
jgi:hypothetical protein